MEVIVLKSKLGKITFLLLCVFIVLYVFMEICTVWMLGDRFDGWRNIIDMSLSGGTYVIIKIFGESFALPIISSIVCFIYLIEIRQGRRIHRFVFAVTALAILAEMLFFIITNLGSYLNSVPILPLLLRSGFFLGFVLLFIDYAKQSLKKILYFVLGCSFAGSVIYWMVGFKNGLASIMQNIEMERGLVSVYIYLESLILPILGLVVSGLVLGYILFPEKYFRKS